MHYMDNDSDAIFERIKDLPQPYRRNAIEWLETCTQTPMRDLRGDMDRFLRRLHPEVRQRFVLQTKRLLDAAVHHFSG
jgi:hypothetical protein